MPEQVVHGFALAGYPCTGKSLVAAHAAACGIEWLRTHAYIEVGSDSVPWDHLLACTDGTRASGPQEARFVVVDSVRSADQVGELEEILDTLHLVCIHCDEAERRVRWDRRLARRHEVEDFDTRNLREKHLGLGDLYCLANRIIDTTGLSHAEFR